MKPMAPPILLVVIAHIVLIGVLLIPFRADYSNNCLAVRTFTFIVMCILAGTPQVSVGWEYAVVLVVFIASATSLTRCGQWSAVLLPCAGAFACSLIAFCKESQWTGLTFALIGLAVLSAVLGGVAIVNLPRSRVAGRSSLDQFKPCSSCGYPLEEWQLRCPECGCMRG